MMLVDVQSYLPGDILTKVDRTSMALSLEARVPLLDHNVVEFALSLPQNLTMRGGQSKWLFRRAIDGIVPRAVLERPKQGFAFPLCDWMRGHLQDEVDSRLRSLPTQMQEFVQPAVVERVWDSFLKDGNRWTRPWSLFALARWIDSAASEVMFSRFTESATPELVPLS